MIKGVLSDVDGRLLNSNLARRSLTPPFCAV
jgi:hypothetical protein